MNCNIAVGNLYARKPWKGVTVFVYLPGDKGKKQVLRISVYPQIKGNWNPVFQEFIDDYYV